MHQDAWGKFIASPPAVVCPPGYEPSIGWDGAPAWATITDGLDTCHQNLRENAPAVIRAFDNFYADRDGIRTAFVQTWGRLAAEFAAEPAVAGYDLLNEPNLGSDPGANVTHLGELTRDAILAIRSGESGVNGGFPHIAFFEPLVLWPLPGTAPAPELVDDPNAVFAPHNYFESLNSILTLEQGFSLAAATAATYGTTFWFGEYGWFSDPAINVEKLTRFAQQEDAHLVSSAWWQWKQACGDPHSINTPGGTPAAVLTHFHTSTCPGDGNQTPVPEWVTVLSRPYPRAAPGRLTALASDGAAAAITLVGQQPPGAQTVTQPLEVWVPDDGQGEPQVLGVNLFDVAVEPVDGGFRVTATTCGTYALAIGAPVADVDQGCNTSDPANSVPILTATLPLQTPRFTG
jgi:endoglycosylceramidase